MSHEKYGVWNEMFDMKRYLHNLNLGFIELKRNVHVDSTDHDCPKEPPRSEWAANHSRAPIAQIPRRVINAHAEVNIPWTEFGARAYQLITRKLSHNTAFAIDTMQGISRCVHSNSFPWYPLISQKLLFQWRAYNVITSVIGIKPQRSTGLLWRVDRHSPFALAPGHVDWAACSTRAVSSTLGDVSCEMSSLGGVPRAFLP